MECVEDDPALRAKPYDRPLRYVYDKSLGKDSGVFQYVFNEGGLTCNRAAEFGDRRCLVSKTELTAIGRESPSFVYADNGCWADNADGSGTSRRDFVLVCGPNVYLCELSRSGIRSKSHIESVQQFFADMAYQGCGIRVLGYARARDTLAESTVSDPNLFLFLGDLHLPPVTWFYELEDLDKAPTTYKPPDWLHSLPFVKLQPIDWLYDYYNLAQLSREQGNQRQARGPIMGNPDIFQSAGTDLVFFLNALSNLDPPSKKLLHFIQTGDMFELWLGRDYQFQSEYNEPSWFDSESPNRVSHWALEVIIQNIPVIEAFRRLERSGLALVKYLWGNHDAYLGRSVVTSQLDLPNRQPFFSALNGDLFCEHGHRFDRKNFDNTDYSFFSGPSFANKAYYFPILREGESIGRKADSIISGHSPEVRDCYLLGATLMYLHQRYDLIENPFSIYVMGHTHKRDLSRFNIRAQPSSS